MSSTPPEDDETVRISIRLDRRLRRVVDLLCMSQDASIQQVVVNAIEEYKDNHRQEIETQVRLLSEALGEMQDGDVDGDDE